MFKTYFAIIFIICFVIEPDFARKKSEAFTEIESGQFCVNHPTEKVSEGEKCNVDEKRKSNWYL